jgi:hypothetical protein
MIRLLAAAHQFCSLTFRATIPWAHDADLKIAEAFPSIFMMRSSHSIYFFKREENPSNGTTFSTQREKFLLRRKII